MKRKVIQTFFVIVISLFIPIFQTYLHYYALSEADILSFNLNFESPDQEILPIMKQNEYKIFLSSASSIIFFSEVIIVKQSPHLSSTLGSLKQKLVILRC